MTRMFSRPPGLAQNLATQVEQLISSRGLRAGDRIATMEELRAQTGYGRATIGETVRLLAERGSVEVRPGRGGGLFAAPVSPVVRLRPRSSSGSRPLGIARIETSLTSRAAWMECDTPVTT